MNVKNRKCIRKLSLKSLYANRRRNLIAIFAIALTTLLFTSMFTIVLSLNASYETYQFRQVGGYAHGTFKDVSPEQAERIAAHPKVKAAGVRKVIGITAEGVFAKIPAEISYMDANCTKWSYATPTTGRMPESGKEVAMDTAALQLLGVTPELGAEVTVSYSITDKDQTAFTVTDTFTLVGYWDYDELMPVHYINISRDYADDIEAQALKTGLQPFRTDLNVMLASGTNIQGQMERGAFRLASYEWGVTYSAMLAAAEATGDQAYYKYVTDRFQFLAEVAPHFRKVLEKYGTVDPQMKQILTPHALDDAGAVCAAMVKVQMKENSPELKPLIDNYMDFIVNKEYRLADGTFARTRPQHNTLWLDDMFMGIPPVAWYSCIAGDKKQMYLSEAVRQIFQFADRMWVPGKNLFRHGWVEGMQDHPAFHWGRANGWALLTMCEVLDVLPEDYPQRDKILELFRAHVRGLAACQSGEGFWHQLLDRNDSYLETSATAIYVYCFAHAINKGWIDAMAYGPVAQLGWHAVTTQINAEGQVDGTCVGTGMAFDPAFYYYRPVNVYAAHGYGPVLWAGAEMINLLNKQHPKMNDSAVQYYRTEQKTSEPIFHVMDGETK